VVGAIEAECDRIHRAVYETYIDQQSAAPLASEEAPWTTR
jgi:hypothetical protein